MPYDPALPADHSPLVSAEMRGQLNGLKELIDAVSGVTSAQVDAVGTVNPGEPATVSVSVAGSVLHLSFALPRGNDGAEGQPGPQGPPISGATIDSVSTLNTGEGATATAFFDGTTVHFTFGLPRGATGEQGGQGEQGIQGPPISSATIDSVNTLNPGDAATATAFFDGTTVHFSFGLPRGEPGEQGSQGVQGPPISSATIDSVNTLNPGDAATATAFFDGTTVHFSFGLPRGEPGEQGSQGVQGIQGPPFASAVIDSVSTLNPGDAATVSVSFDGMAVHFSFGLPRGAPGEPGMQGPPGEVTNAAMADAITTAIAGTSNNTNGVATLDTPFVNDPPTLADIELLRAKVNELIAALRR